MTDQLSSNRSPLSPLLEALYTEAVEQYGIRCLWNIQPVETREGMLVVARHLRQHGDMKAWRLATRIRDAVDHAT